MLDRIIKWDQELSLILNSKGSEVYDVFWVFISDTKSAIPLFLLIIYFLIKKQGIAFWKGVVIILFTVALADFISVHCFKNVFMRYRPCNDPDLINLFFLPKGISKGGLYGFVSSHAANFFAIAGVASALLSERKYMSYLLYSWATLVAYSRIYVGKHYLLDVIGGALLGFVLAKVMWHLVKKIKEKYTLAL